MAVGTKTVVIVLVGGALLAAVILYSAQDRIGETGNTIMQMISSKGNPLMNIILSINLRNWDTTTCINQVGETDHPIPLVSSTDSHGLVKTNSNTDLHMHRMPHIKAKDNQMHPNDDKEFLKITEWWQASSILKWDWEKPPEYICSKIEKRGNWHICNDTFFEVKPPCLVYSFGIWTDWSFDDAMGAIGCEVHSFDPSIGKKSFNRSNNVHFHDLGLSGNDSDTYVPTKDIYVKEKTTWNIRRLKTIMEMLGHTNRHLDVLKIDIETSEWPAVKDMAASGMFSKVRQFAVEWHLFPTYPSRSEYVGIYASVMDMKKQGLRTFRADFHNRNYAEKTFRFQADVNYVNTLYKATPRKLTLNTLNHP